jgi:hypothetical protein
MVTAGVLFREDALRPGAADAGIGEGAASCFIGGIDPAVSVIGTSSGNTVTPVGGEGGGNSGQSIASNFEDLNLLDYVKPCDTSVGIAPTRLQVPVDVSIPCTLGTSHLFLHPLDRSLGKLPHVSVFLTRGCRARLKMSCAVDGYCC